MGHYLKSVLLLLHCALILRITDGALAAMSIDLGSQSLKIGLVKPGVPMEIVLNKDSRRKTPFVVGIKNGERFFGDAAVQMAMKHPANTFVSFLDLLGKTIDNPIVENYKKRHPFANLVADERRNTVVFKTSDGNFNVETLMAMILWNARDQCIAYAGQSVKDVVITIPAYFGQAERKALQDSAVIAGLNLLQLITDGSAAGLNYGVFRRKSITEQEQTLLIYDIGFAKTTATLVGFRLAKEKGLSGEYPVISTLGVGFDRTLGGDTLTVRLRDHLLEQFVATTKPKKDIRQNGRAMAKLTKEAERVKQVLSANAEHHAQIESLFEDKDFKLKVTRDEFLALVKDLELRYIQPVLDALKMAELSADKVDQVVLMGAGTRVPHIQQLLQKTFNGKELGRFLNTDEAAALGAVYQAAHLSQGFKVKKFDVQELQLFPVQVQFKSGSVGADQTEPSIINRILYGYKSVYPASKKVISFTSHQDDFDFNLNYGALSHFSVEQLSYVGAHNITKVDVKGVATTLASELKNDTTKFKGVKVHFHLDNVGVIKVDQAELILERIEPPSNSTLSKIVGKIGEFFSDSGKADPGKIEEESSAEAKSKESADEFGDLPKEDEEALKPDAPESSGEPANQSTIDEKPIVDDVADKKKSEDEKKKGKDTAAKESIEKKPEEKTATPKVAKIPLTVESGRVFYELNAEEVAAASKILTDFEENERQKVERDAAQNLLEAATYDLSSKLDEDEFKQFGTAEELAALEKSVIELKTWLDDAVTTETTKADFDTKKKELDALAKKIRFRKRQNEERGKYVGLLEKALNGTTIESFKSLSSVFTEVELTTLEKLTAETKEWLSTKTKEQKSLADNVDPAFTVTDLKEKITAVEREVKYMLNKMYAAKMKAEQEKLEKAKQEAKAKKEAEKAKNATSADKNEEESSDDTKAEEATPEFPTEKTKEENVEPKSNGDEMKPASADEPKTDVEEKLSIDNAAIKPPPDEL